MELFKPRTSGRKRSLILTVDDGPGPDFSRKTALLHGLNIPAVFFCVGLRLEQRRREAVLAIRQGFVLGNHSWSHRRFSGLSGQEQRDEILRTDDLINRLYAEAGTPRHEHLFRYPFMDPGSGTAAEETRQLLRGLGYTSLDDVPDDSHSRPFDVRDYDYPVKNSLLTRRLFEFRLCRRFALGLKRTSTSKTPLILVLHDRRASKDFFDSILGYLQKRDFRFVLPVRVPVSAPVC